MLLVERMQLGPQRHQVLHGLQRRFDAVTDLDDIAAGNAADPEGQRRLAVMADDLDRTLGVLAFQCGDGAQIDALLALADR